MLTHLKFRRAKQHLRIKKFFGTGNQVIYPDFKLLEKLNQLGIGFEVMPIQALCRTYNFLISEDRKLACILFF